MPRGGRRRTTWTKETKPKGGRKKGSKDKIPRGSVTAIARHLTDRRPQTLLAAMVRGLKGPPGVALGYLQFIADRVDGKVSEHMKVDADVNVQLLLAAKHELTVRLARLADASGTSHVRALLERRAGGVPPV